MTLQLSISVQRLASACHVAASALGIPLQAVYLHGSWATEFARPDSDVDLGLLAAMPIDPALRLQLALRLQRDMDNDAGVDIADLRRADTVFAAHVVSEGRRLLCLDSDATARFEALALAKYARLNEERAGILADIRQRGTIYGSGALA